MKLKDVISRVDGMKPNAFSNEVKTGWICELENMVQTEIFLLAPEEMVEYTWEENAESELLIKAPYSKLYWIYLSAMIDFTHGEYDKYSQTMQMFNTWLTEYQIWYARTFRPADGGAVQMGYYLSAYGLAKLHGFEGTEEEWLDSLKGAPGAPGNGIEKIEELGRGSSVDENGVVLLWTNYRITYAGGVAFDYRIFDGVNGKDGTLKFEELTPEQKESLKGNRGLQGNSIVDIQKDAGDVTGSTLAVYVKDYEKNVTEIYRFQLPPGPTGKAATINGVNALTIEAGDGIDIAVDGETGVLTVTLKSHEQAASTITEGTFAGQVVAAEAAQTPGTSLLRNSKLVSTDTDPTVNGEINWTYG